MTPKTRLARIVLLLLVPLALAASACVDPADDDDTVRDDDDAMDDDDDVVEIDVDLDKVTAFLLDALASDDEIVGVEATVAALGLLGEEIPTPDVIAGLFDDQQREDGTWRGINDDDLHYAVFTMIYAMAYRRIDRVPARAVDSWTARVDTWEKVDLEMRTYENADNYWGGALGYVMLWVSLTGEAPPWIDSLYDVAASNEGDWVSNNHQRSRTVQLLLAAGSEVPLKDDLLTSILAQQNDDLGWGSEEDAVVSTVDDTAQTITVLDRLFADDPAARRAAADGSRYIASLYVESVDSAGFAFRPGEEPEVDATFFALVALVQRGLVAGDLGFHHAIGEGWSGL